MAARAGEPVERAARTFYGVGARFALDTLRDAARRLPAATVWQKAAVEALLDDFYTMQAELAERILKSAEGVVAGDQDPVAVWVALRGPTLAAAEAFAAELRAAPNPDLAMLVVAGRQLRQVLG